MWRHIVQSVQGGSHVADGSPCQDSARVRVLGGGAEAVLVACVADGAGSARYSAEGSSIACETIVKSAAGYLDSHGSLDSLQSEDAIQWCESAREKIRDSAEARGCATREFATTICAAIMTPTRSFFFQIGDGAVVLQNNGSYGVVFWPQSGEYANSTNFLTAAENSERLEFRAVMGSFSDVALFTDRIERLALKFEGRTPHPPFFAPLFGAVRAADDIEPLSGELRRFLESDSVRARSDDDKTLILASRVTD